MHYLCKVINCLKMTDCFDFMVEEISITIANFGEATCVEVAPSLLVMLYFLPLCNCKLVDKID